METARTRWSLGGFCVKMRFSEAIKRFNNWRAYRVRATTVRGYDMVLRQFCLFIRDREIEQITVDDVVAWFNMMQQLEWDPNSFVGKAMALRKFFEFFHRLGHAVIDPWLIPVPRKQYKIPRIAEERSYRKLLAAIPEGSNDPRHIRNRAIANLLWDTGARNGEIVSLNMSDIDTTRMKAVVKTEKSRGWRPVRELFWTSVTNENLKRWITKREYLKSRMTLDDPDALFVSICGGGVHNKSGQRFDIKGVGEMLRRYANRAGIPYMNAHSFRHHMGRMLAEGGANNSSISNILGHSSLQSSYPYTMLADKELEAVYRKHKGR